MNEHLKNFGLGLVFVLFYLVVLGVFSKIEIVFSIFTITLLFTSSYLSRVKLIYGNTVFIFFLIAAIFLENAFVYITLLIIVFVLLSSYLGFKLGWKKWMIKIIFSILLIIIAKFGFANLVVIEKNIKSRAVAVAPTMVFSSREGTSLRLDTIKNKIIVLDLWTTSCGVCFEKFPEYEKLYLQYKDNPSVELYAVNTPIKRDTVGQARKMIEKYNYQFPVLFAKSDSLTKSMGINTFPHLIILKNKKIRFNGSLVLDKDVYFYNLKSEIDFLLKE